VGEVPLGTKVAPVAEVVTTLQPAKVEWTRTTEARQHQKACPNTQSAASKGGTECGWEHKASDVIGRRPWCGGVGERGEAEEVRGRQH
jgi:hypothetical protein